LFNVWQRYVHDSPYDADLEMNRLAHLGQIKAPNFIQYPDSKLLYGDVCVLV